MEERSISMPVEAGGFLALSFPLPFPPSPGGPDGAEEPFALLSLASEGDMAYSDPLSAPNRERFLRSAGADPSKVLGTRLAHSRNVLFPSGVEGRRALAARAASSDAPAGNAGVDGIVLDDPLLVATVTVADCMPIWILDRDSGSFGVLHSGWKGTGILASAVRLLVERRGSRPGAMSAILGPAIGSCCYSVPEERALGFAREFGEGAARPEGGSWRIDLRAANLGLARSLGLGAVLSVDACTSCDPRLGSYRRQGPGSFTRMLAACGRFPLVRPIAV